MQLLYVQLFLVGVSDALKQNRVEEPPHLVSFLKHEGYLEVLPLFKGEVDVLTRRLDYHQVPLSQIVLFFWYGHLIEGQSLFLRKSGKVLGDDLLLSLP